jgi:hypothetical protein
MCAMIKAVEAFMKTNNIPGILPKMDIPLVLVADFASDPLSQYEKVLKKLDDSSWPLHSELAGFLRSLDTETIQSAYADSTFVGLYGENEQLARAWIAQRLLDEQVGRSRMKTLSQTSLSADILPYSADCLRGVKVDAEAMVRLTDFEYNNSTLDANGFSFTVCPTTLAANSSYWLLRSFYEQDLANHISVRLDPFLWGPHSSFPQMMYKMIVYAKPVNWDGIGRLREAHFGQMRADKPAYRSEVTEFCWDPRDDGIHFTCEELPPVERIHFEAARYLHAIYDPNTQAVVHFDGALRIYTSEQLETRQREHLRRAGKLGLRRKIFRIDEPIGREAFSLIAQAFFVWNNDLTKYFTESLSP